AAAMQRSRFTVSIEGNIGSGKSTLLEHFSSSPFVTDIREPLEQWCNLCGTNPLRRLYEDPKRWSLSFNLYAMLTRLRMHQAESSRPVRLLERSLHSTRHCFVESSFADGSLCSAEYSVLVKYYEHLLQYRPADVRVDLYVYLRAPPQVCYERILSRSRSEESCLPIGLIERLHDLHERWITSSDLGAPVLILDAGLDLASMRRVWDEKRDMILCGYSDTCLAGALSPGNKKPLGPIQLAPPVGQRMPAKGNTVAEEVAKLQI
ncbi:hypothetical protein BOX15_Mlig003688g2, partial [Macrostomum lignano]